MIYALIGYMWLFIHRPFEVWPWLGELRIERVYMLLTLAFWATQPKCWTSNRINIGVGFLAIAIFLSATLSPYEGLGSIVVDDWFKVAVFYVLLMTSVREYSTLKALVIAFVAVLAIYELHSLREYLNGRGVYRMGTWRMIGVGYSMVDPNTFAASVLYGIPMLLPLTAIARTVWQTRILYLLFGVGVTCVVLTGSRTGFAGLALGCAWYAVSSKYRWRLLASGFVVGALVWLKMSDNLANRYLTLIDPTRGPANAEVSAESRKQYFYLAAEIWKDNPLFGVGPRGFAYASGTGMQSHSLYAEVISELGIIGVIALSVLITGFFNNFREARRMYREIVPTPQARFCYLTLLATTISVFLLLFLGLGGHNLFRYTWLWYGAFSALALHCLREEVDRIEEQSIRAQ